MVSTTPAVTRMPLPPGGNILALRVNCDGAPTVLNGLLVTVAVIPGLLAKLFKLLSFRPSMVPLTGPMKSPALEVNVQLNDNDARAGEGQRTASAIAAAETQAKLILFNTTKSQFDL